MGEMMEWKYTEDIPLIPVEIINPYNSSKSKHLALVDSGSDWCSLPKQLWDDLDFLEIGLFELGTPLGFTEVGFSWAISILQARQFLWKFIIP